MLEEITKLLKGNPNLALLKDHCVYHLRIKENLPEEEYTAAKEIADSVFSAFPYAFDVDLTSVRSGDINRFLIINFKE